MGTRRGRVDSLNMPLDPVTRSITVKWDRPRYELLDRRGKLVADVNRVSEVTSFGTTDESVSLRFDRGCAAEIGLLSAAVRIPRESPPVIYRPIIEAIATGLDATLAHVDVSLQHLMPWSSDDPVKAQVNAAVRLSGIPTAIDFAFLLDGLVNTKWAYKAEFGIVSTGEVEPRLRRSGGRALGPQMDLAVDPDATAPVSTFVDSHWMIQQAVDVSGDECWAEVSQVDQYAADLVTQLHTQIHGQREGHLGDSA